MIVLIKESLLNKGINYLKRPFALTCIYSNWTNETALRPVKQHLYISIILSPVSSPHSRFPLSPIRPSRHRLASAPVTATRPTRPLTALCPAPPPPRPLETPTPTWPTAALLSVRPAYLWQWRLVCTKDNNYNNKNKDIVLKSVLSLKEWQHVYTDKSKGETLSSSWWMLKTLTANQNLPCFK